MEMGGRYGEAFLAVARGLAREGMNGRAAAIINIYRCISAAFQRGNALIVLAPLRIHEALRRHAPASSALG